MQNMFQDVETFYSQIPLRLGNFKVEDEKFNHFDFLWATNASQLLYSKIIDLMTEIDGNRIS